MADGGAAHDKQTGLKPHRRTIQVASSAI